MFLRSRARVLARLSFVGPAHSCKSMMSDLRSRAVVRGAVAYSVPLRALPTLALNGFLGPVPWIAIVQQSLCRAKPFHPLRDNVAGKATSVLLGVGGACHGRQERAAEPGKRASRSPVSNPMLRGRLLFVVGVRVTAMADVGPGVGHRRFPGQDHVDSLVWLAAGT